MGEEATMDFKAPTEDAALRRRRMLAAIAGAAALAGVLVICGKFFPAVYTWLADADGVRAYVAEHPVPSRLIIVGVNILQVLLAFLPGEPVELASGYAFGFVEGTILCLIASAVASSAIYFAVRTWGWRVVGLFFNRSHLERYGWINNARRLELIMLIVFLIPGTPKDFFTYFAGLTRMRFTAVLAIATVGRIPSIVTSTIAASAFGEGNYVLAAIAVVVAGALIAVGGMVYRWFEAHERS